jgi:hypothetical protein
MSHQWRESRTGRSAVRLGTILAALAAMVIVGLDLSARLESPGHRAAKVMLLGYQRSAVPDAGAIEDEAVTGSDNEAGYRWAERHSLDRSASCPDFTAEFRQGCQAYVREQSR